MLVRTLTLIILHIPKYSFGFLELDKRLGDINGKIIDHENRILSRLSGFICKYNKNIRDPLKVIGLMDWQVVFNSINISN